MHLESQTMPEIPTLPWLPSTFNRSPRRPPAPGELPVSRLNFCSQAHGHLIHSGGVQYDSEALEQQNQVQSIIPEPSGHQRRWPHPQHRSVGVLPQPEPEEETKPFILDLKNFPDLANADINSQNPNIQVSRQKGDTLLDLGARDGLLMIRNTVLHIL